MSMLLPHALPDEDEAPASIAAVVRPAPSRWEVAEWAGFLSAMAILALYVLPRRGGWEPSVVPTACALLLPCVLVQRPWRRVPAWQLMVAGGPAAGGLVVAVAAPFGDGGPISLARWGLAGSALLLARAFAVDRRRREAVVVAALLTGVWAVASAWEPWLAALDSGRYMTGPLTSANPFGGLCLAVAVTSAAAALLGRRALALTGWVAAPVASLGVVLSASRGATLLLLLSALLIGALVGRARGVRGLLAASVLGLTTWGLLLLATSPYVTGAEGAALRGMAEKQAAGQTVSSTTGVRVDFWYAAARQFLESSAVGGGSGSYAGSSRQYMAPAAQLSPFAHNEALGSLAEGGLVLGVPVLLVLSTAAGTSILRSWQLLRAPARAEAAVTAAALGAGVLVAHAQVDYVLSFPFVLALLGLLLGAALAAPGPCAGDPSARKRVLTAAVLVTVISSGTLLGVVHDSAGVSSRAVVPSADHSAVQAGPLRDGRLLIAAAEASTRGQEVDREASGRLAEDLEPLADIDPAVQGLRVHLLARSGQAAAATALAARTAQDGAERWPLLLVPYAERLVADGRPHDAYELLAAEAFRRADPGRLGRQLTQVLEAADDLAPRVEPARSCALRELMRHRVVNARSSLRTVPVGAVTRAECETWAAQAPALRKGAE
jgi:hypothetical protein